MNRAPSIIYGWLAGAADGLDRLYDTKRPGVPRRLAARHLAELKEDLMAGLQKHGFESGMWTGKLVVEHVRRKYHVQYVPRTMQTLLREMGFKH